MTDKKPLGSNPCTYLAFCPLLTRIFTSTAYHSSWHSARISFFLYVIFVIKLLFAWRIYKLKWRQFGKFHLLILPVFSKIDQSSVSLLDLSSTIHFSVLSITEVLIATSKYFRFGWLCLLIKDRVSLRQSCLLCDGHARGQAKQGEETSGRGEKKKTSSISFLIFFVIPSFGIYTWKTLSFLPPALYKLQWNVPSIQGEWPFQGWLCHLGRWENATGPKDASERCSWDRKNSLLNNFHVFVLV